MIKSLVLIGGILVALVPWLSGGRDATAMLISVFALAITAFLMLRETKLKNVASRPLLIAIGLWLGWGTLSILWSANRYQSELWLLMMLIAVLAGLLAANLGKRQKEQLILGYFFVAALTGAIGIFLYLTGEYNRLTSTFYWANPMGAYLIPALYIGIWQWLRFRRPADMLLTGVIAVSFWLTYSRGAILVLLITSLAAIIATPLTRQYWRRLILFVLITFGLAYGLSALKTNFVQGPKIDYGTRFEEAVRGESTSGQDRANYLKSAAAIWWEHPLLGTGAGSFGTVHPQYQQRVISASTDVHNIYVQTLAEQGIIGAALLAWVIILLLIGIGRGYTRDNHKGILVLGVIALLMHFGLDIDARYPALLVLLTVLIGVTYEPWHTKPVIGYRRWLAPALIAAALVLSVSNYLSSSWKSRGEVYDYNNNLQAAADAYSKSHRGLMYDPDSFGAEGIDYFSLATLTNGSKTNQDKARGLADQAIKRDPQDSQHYFLLGRIEYLSGNLAAAEKAYRRAIGLDRFNHPEYYQDLASLQLKQGDTASAQRTVDEVLNMYSDEVVANRATDETVAQAISQLLAFRAADQLSRGDKNAAQATIDRAYDIYPNNRDVNILKATLSAQN